MAFACCLIIHLIRKCILFSGFGWSHCFALFYLSIWLTNYAHWCVNVQDLDLFYCVSLNSSEHIWTHLNLSELIWRFELKILTFTDPIGHSNDIATKRAIRNIHIRCHIGDWFVLMQIRRNCSMSFFKKFLKELESEIIKHKSSLKASKSSPIDWPNEAPSNITTVWCIWTNLNVSERIWNYLKLSELILTYLNLSELIWTYLNIFELIRTHLNVSEYIWTWMTTVFIPLTLKFFNMLK